MILSFNPVITGEENMICAGRPPGQEEKEAILEATAIILPQGVREDLFRLCHSCCPQVWPDYTLRFNYPGKVGQSMLFAAYNLPRPRTVVFPSIKDFLKRRQGAMPLPFVFKTNLDDMGQGIYPVHTTMDRKKAFKKLEMDERIGRNGFLQQEILDTGGRDLRVVLIGRDIKAYWRIQPEEGAFFTNLSAGGKADFNSDPELIKIGVEAVREFSDRAGLDLAGFDLIFDLKGDPLQPLFIEVNWFFGREALGGSMEYYKLLKSAATDWLNSIGLKRGRVRSRPKYSPRD